MLVSVVTPCLNPGEARIRRCLLSVASQTHDDIEHVVVDGGSTDGTVELLRSAGVRHISEPDNGQADAIAKGFRLATGSLLTWLNADDELVPEAAATAVGSRADWVYGDCVVVHGEVRRLWRPPRRYGPWEVDAGEMIPQPGCFFTREALDAVGGIDTSFELTMDIDLWIRFVDAGVAPRYIPRVLAVFEIHDRSKTASLGPKRFQLEHARALAKSGRYGAASAAVGRAVALGGPLEDGELPSWADERIVAAAAAAECGIEALRVRDLAGASRLLSPRVVGVRESRRRVIASARRALRLG